MNSAVVFPVAQLKHLFGSEVVLQFQVSEKE